MNIKAKALFLFFLFFVGSFVAIAQNEVLIEHKGYSVLYSLEYKSPLYVTWTLKKSDLVCPVRYKRKGMNFHKDPLFGGSLDLNKDYKKSGYDKGHMCPAADRACNDTALFDTFCFTNCTMQHPELNRKKWEQLESDVRRWVVSGHDSLVIFSGTIFDTQPAFVGYDRVAVPLSFYKIIYEPKTNKCVSYRMENKCCNAPINSYATTISEIEKISGRYFFKLEGVKMQCDTTYFK